MRQQVPVGKPLKASFAQNCSGCKNFYMCRDPDKGVRHLCSRFTSIDDLMREDERMTEEIVAKDPESRAKKKKLDKTREEDEQKLAWEPQQLDTQRDLREMMKREIENGIVKRGDYSSKQVDDSDFPLAKNFYHFMRSKRFVGLKPFPKQIEIGIGFMSEYCPRCSDMEWLIDVPTDAPLSHFRSKAQLLHKGVCPACGARKSELVATEELRDYYTLGGLAGQRGSKSMLISMLAGYRTHQQLKLDMPPVDYGLVPTQVLTATFVAPTFKQAFDNLWTPLAGLIELSDWYQQYHKMLDYYGGKNGDEILKFMDSFLSYRHKNLMIAASAADGRTLRGYTRFAASIDELGWFGINDKNIKLNADQVFTALDRSLFTLKNAHSKRRRRGNDILPAPSFFNVSSPSSWQDRICRLVKESEGSSTIYSFHYATWEMNPEVSRTHPDLVEAEKNNRATFLRDYAAQPPLSSSPFIDDVEKFKALFKHGNKNPVVVTRDIQKSRTKRKMTGGYISKKNWRNETGRCLAIDAGETNNCLAGETRVLTRNGVKPIRKLRGTVEVLTAGSKWVEAEFNTYGKQRLWEIILSNNGQRKTIRATANHRWFAYKGRSNKKLYEITTDELQPGYKLESVMPPSSNAKPSVEGIRHGVVYGDGSRHQTPNFKWSMANLVGAKIGYLREFFEEFKSRGKYWEETYYNGNDVLRIRNLPRRWKRLPGLDESPEYLMGFLSGYISTDGCVDTKGRVMLNSVKRKDLVRVKNICNTLGITTTGITSQTAASPYTGKPFTCYKIFFHRNAFPAELLLNPEHRKRFDGAPSPKSASRWTVESVTRTDKKEMTYCASVPKTHSFVLEDYILTGNSFALAMGRVDPDDGTPIIEALLEIIPFEGHPINFTDVFDEVIAILIERYGVMMLVADRWQSSKILTDAEALEVSEEFLTEKYSLKKADFVSYREAVYEGNIVLPKPEMDIKDIVNADAGANYREKFAEAPISHFYFQNVTVVETMKSVEKGQDTTDDLFRAAVLLHSYLVDPEYSHLFSGDNVPDVGGRKDIGVAVVLGSGGGTGGSGTSAPGIVYVPSG